MLSPTRVLLLNKHTNAVMKKFLCIIIVLAFPFVIFSQGTRWSVDGNSYYEIEAGELVQYSLPGNNKSVVVTRADLTPRGQHKNISIRNFMFSQDGSQVLIYTNSKKVWRLDTQGDYWVLNLKTK